MRFLLSWFHTALFTCSTEYPLGEIVPTVCSKDNRLLCKRHMSEAVLPGILHRISLDMGYCIRLPGSRFTPSQQKTGWGRPDGTVIDVLVPS